MTSNRASGPGRRGRRQRGFTLVEIAIVLLIVAILLGYTVVMFPRQEELKDYRAAAGEMDSIVEHLVAFAQVNGRLPCPDTQNVLLDGLEDRVGLNSCSAYFGFLPGRTLGLNGDYDPSNVLLDPWGTGYGYAVSPAQDGVFNRIFVTRNGVRDFGVAAALTANAAGGLYLCTNNTNAPANDTSCASVVGGNELLGSTGQVAAVVISLGKENAIPATSAIQAENLDNFNDGTLDRVYIVAPRNEFEGALQPPPNPPLPSTYYDDIVKWIPANLLFSRMIDAGQLP